MSDEQLNLLKEQLTPLSPEEKWELARFLLEQAKADQAVEGLSGEIAEGKAMSAKRAQHMAWLKAHREEYAGKYVALDGDRLVGFGASIQEARDQARRQGVDKPFIAHVSSANDVPFGGW